MQPQLSYATTRVKKEEQAIKVVRTQTMVRPTAAKAIVNIWQAIQNTISMSKMRWVAMTSGELLEPDHVTSQQYWNILKHSETSETEQRMLTHIVLSLHSRQLSFHQRSPIAMQRCICLLRSSATELNLQRPTEISFQVCKHDKKHELAAYFSKTETEQTMIHIAISLHWM